jgi:two-component system LytT family response regulator
MRIAIVDDEAHARAAIRILLASQPDVDIVAECRSGVEALEVLRWMDVDLLLLDVQMPEMDGFDVIRALGPGNAPPTVFITAYDEYAIRAFEIGVVDYVLKPFDESRFLAAFNRARARIAETKTLGWALQLVAAMPQLAADRASPAPLSRLPVSVGHEVVFVDFDDIDWIQAADQYVLVHVGEKEYLLRESLQRLAVRLPAERFAQIHRCHIVNVAKVRAIRRLHKGDAQVTLADGRQLRLSRRYRKSLDVLRWTQAR